MLFVIDLTDAGVVCVNILSLLVSTGCALSKTVFKCAETYMCDSRFNCRYAV